MGSSRTVDAPLNNRGKGNPHANPTSVSRWEHFAIENSRCMKMKPFN